MNKSRIICLMAAITGCVFNTAQASDWPYAQDIPKATAVDIGVASDRPVDISRFLLARGPGFSSINKQGSDVAYSSNVTGINQLWIMPAKGGQARQLTFGNGITFFRWLPDGKHLIYGADNEGDEREAFYLISKDGTKEELVLGYSDGFRRFGGFNDEGSKFTYASTERNGRDFDLYTYDMRSGKSAMVFEAEFGFFPAAWRPGQQQFLVTETRGEDGNDLHIFDLAKKEIRTLYKPEISANYGSFNWTKNGNGFYFVTNQDGEMNELKFHDIASGTDRVIVSRDVDIDDVSLCKNDSVLVYTENHAGFEQVFIQSGNSTRQVKVPPGTFSVTCGNGDNAMLRGSHPDSPGTLYQLSLSSATAKAILQPQMAGIDPGELVTPVAISFPARDDVMLHGMLYMPKTTGDKKPPLVVDIHGGPTAQSRATWQPLVQYLVGKGIAVLDINVRGSTGYGKTYARLDNQEKRLDSVRDLVDALAWLKQDGRVDADNAAAMGGSYGGYMVNAVMGAYPGAFKAGASFVGVANWVRALQTASPGLKASDRIEYGDIREERWQTFYAANSPINTVNKIEAPMFFQHGANDPRDPVTESDEMVLALREKGVPVTYLRFPDEGHSVRKLGNRITYYRSLADFLETNLAD